MLFIRLPGELSDAAMESGEIRKNTRLNIYSDEEAQVRHIMTPYFLLVLGFPCVFVAKNSDLYSDTVAIKILIPLSALFLCRQGRTISSHLRLN